MSNYAGFYGTGLYGDEADADTPDITPLVGVALELSVEVETTTGRRFRWDAHATHVADRPTIAGYSTQIGDGFGPSSVELSRRRDIDWPDIQDGATIRYIANDGSIVYEGRILKAEATSGRKFTVETVGWATYLRQRPFCELYVDRDPSNWGPPSLDFRIANVNNDRVMDVHYTAEATGDSLRFSGTKDEAIPQNSRAILQYTAPTGVLVSEIQYSGSERNIAAAQEEDPTLYATDDDSQTVSSWDDYALTLDDAVHQRALADGYRRHLALMLNAAANPSHNPNLPAHRTFKKMAIYGDHGVTLADNGTAPDGVTASDAIDNILSRFAPKVALETEGTSYVIEHLAFREPTTPYDAIIQCNEFHHWNVCVYEGPTLHFDPINLETADWLVREDWDGVEVDLPLDTSEQVNGVPVSYEDVETGRTEILWPTDNEELRDDSDEHPANKLGEDRWSEPFAVPFPCTEKMALQLGAEQLLDLNTPKAPGTIRVPTRIKDSHGNWQPAWRPRAGDTVAVTTHPNPGVHLITSTSFDPESKTLEISTDYDIRTLDVFLARLEAARVGRF